MPSPLGRAGWRRLFSSDGDLLRRAGAQVAEAVQLARYGRLTEAHAAENRSIAMFRELMRYDRDRALPFFVTALQNRAMTLQRLGRHSEALRDGREMLDLARDPAAGPPLLAVALSRYAELLLHTGAVREALALTTEAINVAGPAPTVERADVLTHHMLAQTACGRLDDALRTSADGVVLWRTVAAGRLFEHGRELGRALSNHAYRLRDAGRIDEAVAVAEEGLAVMRRAAAVPEATLPGDLPHGLTRYAVLLARTGRPEEAVAVAGEAVDRYRELTVDGSAASRENLAGALNIFGNRLQETGRRPEARAVLGEAVGLYRELAAADRGGRLVWLAQAVSNHALVLDDPQERLAVSQEAVDLHRELLATDREAHLDGLARSVLNHAGRLREAGRPAEAVTLAREGLELHREFAAGNRVSSHGAPVGSLLLLASWLPPDEGLPVAEEALALARDLRPESLPEALRAVAGLLGRAPGATKARRRRARALTAEAARLED